MLLVLPNRSIKGGKTMAGRAEVWCYPSKTILLFILPVVFFSLSSFLFFFLTNKGEVMVMVLVCINSTNSYVFVGPSPDTALKHMCVV